MHRQIDEHDPCLRVYVDIRAQCLELPQRRVVRRAGFLEIVQRIGEEHKEVRVRVRPARRVRPEPRLDPESALDVVMSAFLKALNSVTEAREPSGNYDPGRLVC